jgi:hypothetical protein
MIKAVTYSLNTCRNSIQYMCIWEKCQLSLKVIYITGAPFVEEGKADFSFL